MADNKIIINIGRQFGSGGRQVAAAIGQKLGIKVYDSELISEAAEKSGFSKSLLQKSDESRSIFSISNFLASGRFGVADSYTSDNEMFKIQSSVIEDIADRESAIFIGRCSDYILRERKCLDVFITSPMQVRVKRVAERAGLSAEQAEAVIKKTDRNRETYYNYFTFGNWGMASNYDLCIDSSILGIEETADLIIDFAKKEGLL